MAPKMDLDVHDCIGDGDSFSSGFIYGIPQGLDPEERLWMGWAHGALIMTYPCDSTKPLAGGSYARIQY